MLTRTQLESGGTDYIELRELLGHLGCHPRTLRKHLRARRVALFADPIDHRRRLVRHADIVRLLAPECIERTHDQETTAA